MSYADRIKETATTTGTDAFTLAGAVTGFKTFASRLTVGDRVAYCIEGQTPGEWEIGIGTLSGATTLTRTYVSASSNSDALVNFSAGTKNVFVTATASQLVDGLVDPADAGYDIILLIGQSNMAGRGTLDTSVEIADNRVWQFGGKSSDGRYQTIFVGNDPLHNFEYVNTGQMSLGTVACKTYASIRPSNRRVLMVPCANGGTPLYSGAANWSVGGNLYLNAITQANAAITAALLQYPSSRFVGCFWHQGESDALAGVTQSQYQIALTAAIAGYRAGITGAANSWFVIGGMVPEAIAGNPSGYNPIVAAHQATALAVSKCVYVAGPSGYTGDSLHYNAAGCRIMGVRMALAVRTAQQYSAVDVTAPTALSPALVANATPTFVDITMSEAMDTAYTPASSTVTISGHTVSALAYTSATNLRATVSAGFAYGEAARTAAYTSNGTNNLRDAAGNQLANFSGLAITNNVIGAATAVSMSGPSGGVELVASTNFSLGVTPLTGTISGTLVVTPSDGGAGGTFTPTTVSLTTGSPTGTFTYTPASTGAKTISVTNNGGLTNPSNITYTATSGATVPGAPTIGTATFGDTTATFPYTAPGSDGGSAILDYTLYVYRDSDDVLLDTDTGITASPAVNTGRTNGVAVYGKVAARNAIGTGAQSGESNVVTPAAADLRARSGFTMLTEGGSTGAWTYTAAGESGFNAAGAVMNQGRAASSANAAFTYVRQAHTSVSADKFCVCVISGTSPLALAGRVFTFLHDSAGTYTGYAGSGAVTPNGADAPQTAAVGDWVRVRFTSTTSCVFEVSKNSGSSWLLIHTLTGVTTGALNFQLQILGNTPARFGGFVGANLTAN